VEGEARWRQRRGKEDTLGFPEYAINNRAIRAHVRSRPEPSNRHLLPYRGAPSSPPPPVPILVFHFALSSASIADSRDASLAARMQVAKRRLSPPETKLLLSQKSFTRISGHALIDLLRQGVIITNALLSRFYARARVVATIDRGNEENQRVSLFKRRIGRCIRHEYIEPFENVRL